jgi:hypothetical protein
MSKRIPDELFCGDDREQELSDEYDNDTPYFVSLDEVDFELENDEEDDQDM